MLTCQVVIQPVQICFPFLAIKTFLTINFFKAFSSDYKRSTCFTLLFKMQMQRTIMSLCLYSLAWNCPADLGWGAWPCRAPSLPPPTVAGGSAAAPVPAIEQESQKEAKEMVSSREGGRCCLPGPRLYDSSLPSELTPKSSFCQPWEIWCHL